MAQKNSDQADPAGWLTSYIPLWALVWQLVGCLTSDLNYNSELFDCQNLWGDMLCCNVKHCHLGDPNLQAFDSRWFSYLFLMRSWTSPTEHALLRWDGDGVCCCRGDGVEDRGGGEGEEGRRAGSKEGEVPHWMNAGSSSLRRQRMKMILVSAYR